MSPKQSRTVSWDVITMVPLPAGDQVFVAGNEAALGSWRPDGLPLARVGDGRWQGQVVLPRTGVEYKITRGAWGAEEVARDGRPLPNRQLPEGGNEVVRILVHDWADLSNSGQPGIVGDFRVHETVTSRYLRQDRRVIVWLPPSYAAAKRKRYPVIYLQDGQQVFDPRTATRGQGWGVDAACTQLIAEGAIREVIAVAIYNTADREEEYDPAESGEAYVRFVAEELKPFVDGTYRTQRGAEDTAVAGSARGAVVAFHMAWTRPEVFSRAACLSPAFAYGGGRDLLERVASTVKPPRLKLYLYCGKGDELECELRPGVLEMERLLLQRGYEQHRDLVVVEDPCAAHHEAAWGEHTPEWLTFFFGAQPTPSRISGP